MKNQTKWYLSEDSMCEFQCKKGTIDIDIWVKLDTITSIPYSVIQIPLRPWR